jgi:putative transposase
MLVTERIKVKWSDELHDLCHESKDLYNRANYLIRQNYFYAGDELDYQFVNYDLLYFQIKNDPSYKVLPAQLAQQTLRVLEKNWSSFFEAMKAWKANPSKFLGMPRPPKYKNRDGENVATFTNQQCWIEGGVLRFPPRMANKPGDVKTRLPDDVVISEVRLIPRGLSYIIEIVYERPEDDLQLNKKNLLSIDLGLNNIVTCADNIGDKPFVIWGGAVKSINQYYNKKKTWLQSIKDLQGYDFETKRMQRLTEKRNWKIYDYFHKVSRIIVDHCIQHDIGTIAIGYNEEWKQHSNIGKRNNQNFVSIPFLDLVKKIEYKAKLVGIDVVLTEESYTSKASFLDLDEFAWEYCTGRRLRTVSRRGVKCRCNLYKRSNGQKIHADVNAAYNIGRKAVPEAYTGGIEGLALVPRSVVVDATVVRNQTRLAILA